MTKAQQKKLNELGDDVLDYYESIAGLIVVTMKYGTKYFCLTFIGERGGMCYKECKVYKNYTKEDGLSGYIFTEYN